MGVRKPRYSKEEFARRGQAIYEQRVRPQVKKATEAGSWRLILRRASLR